MDSCNTMDKPCHSIVNGILAMKIAFIILLIVLLISNLEAAFPFTSRFPIPGAGVVELDIASGGGEFREYKLSYQAGTSQKLILWVASKDAARSTRNKEYPLIITNIETAAVIDSTLFILLRGYDEGIIFRGSLNKLPQVERLEMRDLMSNSSSIQQSFEFTETGWVKAVDRDLGGNLKEIREHPLSNAWIIKPDQSLPLIPREPLTPVKVLYPTPTEPPTPKLQGNLIPQAGASAAHEAISVQRADSRTVWLAAAGVTAGLIAVVVLWRRSKRA